MSYKTDIRYIINIWPNAKEMGRIDYIHHTPCAFKLTERNAPKWGWCPTYIYVYPNVVSQPTSNEEEWHFAEIFSKKMREQIDLNIFQTPLIQYIAVQKLSRKEGNVKLYKLFSLINMIYCLALTWRGEGENCVKTKFAQTSLVFPHLKINQKRLGSLILSFVYLMGCCRIYGCN